MKALFYLTSFLSIFLLQACGSTSKINSGEVEYLGESEQGTILLTAAGYGSSQSEAITNAEINAFRTLIFKGVPGSQYHLPIIKDEASALHTHSGYFKHLLDAGGYKSFLMQSESNANYSSKATLTQRIKINVASLRRDMEGQGVIRKFGL